MISPPGPLVYRISYCIVLHSLHIASHHTLLHILRTSFWSTSSAASMKTIRAGISCTWKPLLWLCTARSSTAFGHHGKSRPYHTIQYNSSIYAAHVVFWSQQQEPDTSVQPGCIFTAASPNPIKSRLFDIMWCKPRVSNVITESCPWHINTDIRHSHPDIWCYNRPRLLLCIHRHRPQYDMIHTI